MNKKMKKKSTNKILKYSLKGNNTQQKLRLCILKTTFKIIFGFNNQIEHKYELNEEKS